MPDALLEERLREGQEAAKGAVAPQELIEAADEWLHSFRESFQLEYGYDPDAVVGQVGKLREGGGRVGWGNIKDWVQQTRRLSEAVSETQLGALIRYGVVKMSVDYYKLVKAVYRALAQMETSTGYEETYDPLNRTEIPIEVAENESPPESKLVGRAVLIRNRRFARMIAISKRLYANDKTGQVKKRATQIGEGMVYAEEILWITSVINAYLSTANLTTNGGLIPPTNVAGQAVLDGQDTTAGRINQQRIEDGYTAAGYVTDLNGNFFVVDFDSLLVSKVDEIPSLKLLQSFLNPSGAGSAGAIGGIMMKNVMEGRLGIYASRFVSKARAGLDSSAPPWSMMEKGKGNVFQTRTAMSMVMEPPNAGKSLEENSFRYLTEREMAAGQVEPRFTYYGN